MKANLKRLVALLIFCLGGNAAAQDFGLPGGAPAAEVTASLVANVTAVAPGKPFLLGIQLQVPKGYYTYYKSPGSIGLPTKVSFSGPEGFDIGAPQFPGPDVKYVAIGKQTDINYVYKHNTIILASVTPPADAKVGEKVTFTAEARYQYCAEDGACYPPKPRQMTLSLPVAAESSPSTDAPAMSRVQRNLPIPGNETKYAKVSAKLSKPSIAPGETAELIVTVEVEEGYKLQMNQPPVKGLISTDLILDAVPGVKSFPPPSYPPPEAPAKPIPGFENTKEYRGTFEIRVPVVTTDKLQGNNLSVSGLLHYQACDKTGTCFPAIYASFDTSVPIREGVAGAPAEVVPAPVAGNGSGDEGPAAVAPAGFINQVVPPEEKQRYSFVQFLLLAYLGGLILNVMPCVLPVLIIKVLSFVNQAGESRSRILALNIMYSLGVLSIFMTLSTLAVVANIGWGGLFQFAEFNVIMAAIVFAMGLSLLGVFEIPVPGFIGSASGTAHREGPLGAYLTGIFATLLATPCTGPFLGVTLGYAIGETPVITYAIFAMMGLGMSSPYLLVGLFPGAVKWLPKPGNWMVTFKEFSGLVLMATVVFIISSIEPTYTLPVLVMLVGIALAAWMIGSLYTYNSKPLRKNTVRLSAFLIAVGIGYFAMTTVHDGIISRQRQRLIAELEKLQQNPEAQLELIGQSEESESELPWQPFSDQRLEKLIGEGRTVLVDFSAAWCLTCKANEVTALNTKATRDLVRKNDVATLYADFTEYDPEIRKWLTKFNREGVPLLVIFPGKDPTKPIVLPEVVSKSEVIARLEEAGPSTTAAAQAAVQGTTAQPVVK